MDESVAKENDQLCQKLELQEVDSLDGLTPKTNSQTYLLTKDNFTRDEWNNLLHWCVTVAIHPENDVEKDQQGTGEETIVAKSKPTLNQVARSAASSSTAPRSSASNPVSKVRIS